MTDAAFLERVLPEDRGALRNARQALTPERPLLRQRYRFRRFSGGSGDEAVIWLQEAARGEFDTAGRLRRVRGLVVDVTDQVRAEEVERTAAARLREASDQKDHFIAMLGHELRNPLAAISMGIAVLERLAGEDERLGPIQQILGRQSRHMEHMVDGLLDVARFVRGKIRLERRPLELGPLLRDAAEARAKEIEGADLALELDLPDGPLWVEGDRVRLCQAVDNLLANSVKFTPPQGEVTLRLSRDQRAAVIEVVDTGLGIEPELLAHVFEPFQQASQSIDRSAGGLGLGLAVVKQVVEQHGGAVRADSPGPGRGSTFTLRLPLSDAPAEPDDRQPEATPDGASRRIVLVEDSPDAAEALRTLLVTLGHQVTVASTGEEGLERIRADSPDVVLCDIGLPGALSGYDLARSVRADPTLQVALLVAVTGYGLAEDQLRAEEAGFDAHLVKPVDVAALEELLEGTRRR